MAETESAAVEAKEGEPVPKVRPVRAAAVDTHDLKRRFDQLVQQRKPVEGVWDQIERYFFPLGSTSQPYNLGLSEGNVAWNRWQVWDSTAIDAAQKLAANIHGTVTSPAIRWFRLSWRDDDLVSDNASCAWLDQVAERVFATLMDSDFNTEIASADQDLVGFGNCFIVEEPADETEWRGVDFESIPLREGFFEQDSRGDIEKFYRALNWTPVQIVDLCRRRGWKAPEEIEKKANSGQNLEERIQVVFAVYRRHEQTRRLELVGKRNREESLKRMRGEAAAADEPTYPLAPLMRPVGCAYFLAASGEQIGEESGYYEMPVSLARWSKTAGSIWGHGPCNILLPTVKYLNAWMETEHMAAAKVVDPPLLVDELGVMSDLNLEPGGQTVVRSKDAVTVLESKARFDVSQNKVNELRLMVQRGLHNDELMLKDSPAMTATEVQARYELMNRVLGATLARIETGLLSPIVKITIGHLARASQLPPAPPKVQAKFASGSADFDIEYQGPLARSQRTDEVAAIERVLSFAAGLLKMGIPLPVIQATIDVVAAIRQVADRLGTPASLLKDPEESKKALAEMAAVQERAQNAQIAKTEGEARSMHANAAAQLATAQAAGPGNQAPVAPGMEPTPATPMPIVTPRLPPSPAGQEMAA